MPIVLIDNTINYVANLIVIEKIAADDIYSISMILELNEWIRMNEEEWMNEYSP